MFASDHSISLENLRQALFASLVRWWLLDVNDGTSRAIFERPDFGHKVSSLKRKREEKAGKRGQFGLELLKIDVMRNLPTAKCRFHALLEMRFLTWKSGGNWAEGHDLLTRSKIKSLLSWIFLELPKESPNSKEELMKETELRNRWRKPESGSEKSLTKSRVAAFF